MLQMEEYISNQLPSSFYNMSNTGALAFTIIVPMAVNGIIFIIIEYDDG